MTPKNLPALISEIAEVGEKAHKYSTEVAGIIDQVPAKVTDRHLYREPPLAVRVSLNHETLAAYQAGALSQAPIRLALLEALKYIEDIRVLPEFESGVEMRIRSILREK